MSYANYQTYEKDARWEAVDHYSFPHLHPATSTTPSNNVLDHALSNSDKNSLPNIAVSPSQGKLLMLQCKLIGAKNVLELGTLGGYSTIWMANASKEINVTTIEYDAHHAKIAKENLEYAGVSKRVEIRQGAGLDVLPQLLSEVKDGKRPLYDLIFVDADKENNWAYVDIAVGMCRAGACVIVDNVVRKGAVANVELAKTDVSVAGSRKVIEMIGKDERFDGVVIQMVGDKSYDGMLISIVN